MENQN